MARANPHLRSLRIFDPDADLAIDEEPVAAKGKKSVRTTEDFMMDPLLTLAEETDSSPPQPDRKAPATPAAPATAPTASSETASFDEDLGGKVVEL